MEVTNTNPSLGDIDRGVKNKTSKRILYQELATIADKSRESTDKVSLIVKKNLTKEAEKINESGK